MSLVKLTSATYSNFKLQTEPTLSEIQIKTKPWLPRINEPEMKNSFCTPLLPNAQELNIHEYIHLNWI